MENISGIFSFKPLEENFSKEISELEKNNSNEQLKFTYASRFNNLFLVHESKKEKKVIYESENFVIAGISNDLYFFETFKTVKIGLSCLLQKITDGELSFDNFEEKLSGEFFLIVYKKKEKEICVVRDTFGFVPAYYFISDDGLIFSTDQRYIEKTILKSLSVNLNYLANYIDLNNPEPSETFFNEIKKLNSSHRLNLSLKDKLIVKKYKNSLKELSLRKNKKKKQVLFKELLNNSIKRKIDDNKNYNMIGLLLSGGLDSSVIGLSLRENFLGEIFSYSMNYSNDKFLENVDEEKYQRLIIEKINSSHTCDQSKNFSPFQSISADLFLIGEPYHFPNIHIYKNAYESFKNHNVKVYFDGYDGDTVVSHGYEYLKELVLKLKFIKLFKAIKSYSKLRKKSTLWFVKFIINVLKSELIIRLRLQFSILKKRNKSFPSPTFFSSHSERINNSLISLGLEYTYKLDNFYGVKRKCPFFDIELTKFSLSTSSKNKFGNGETRFIMREAFKKELPEPIRKRLNKSNLGLGLIRYFSHVDLKIIKDERNSVHALLENLINLQTLDSMIQEIDLRKKQIRTETYIYLLNFCIANKWLKEIVVKDN